MTFNEWMQTNRGYSSFAAYRLHLESIGRDESDILNTLDSCECGYMDYCDMHGLGYDFSQQRPHA